MGGESSKSTVTSVSENITQVAMNFAQHCQTIVNQRQVNNIMIAGDLTGGTIDASQSLDVDFECISKSDVDTKLQAEIMNQIENAAKTSGITALSALSDISSEANTEIRNMVRSSITRSNLQSQYNHILQTQNNNIIVLGNVTNTTINMRQGAQVFAKATVDILESAGVFNRIKSLADSTAETKSSTPVVGEIADAVGSLLDGFGELRNFAIVIIVVIVLIILGVSAYVVIRIISSMFGSDGYKGPSMEEITSAVNTARNALPQQAQTLPQQQPQLQESLPPQPQIQGQQQ